MINLTQEEKDLFLQFQERWSLEKVKNMTLEKYTGFGNIGKERDDFVYWIEYKLKDMGRFSSRGVEKGKKSMGLFADKDKVHFNEKLGKNKKEVFEIVKADIIKVINFSQANQLEKIDSIKTLDSIYKWKIAFHYQNIDDMGIMCIFSKSVLQEIAKGENLGLGENPSIAKIYRELLKDKTYSLETMVNEKSMPLWEKYGLQNNKEKEKMETSNQTNTNKVLSNRQIPLNQILYGPPGTGKTYQTIDKALEILKYHKMIDNIPESRLKKVFDEYKANGQIAFITFHQSFSYEEFVEGIKPKIDKNSQKMTYEVQNGIFKNICEKAKNNLDIFNQKIESQQNVSLNSNKTLWRLYTIPDGTPKSDFFDECIEKEQVWVYKQDSNGNIENDNIKGDYLVIPTASKGMSQTIRAFGVFGDFIEEKEGKLYRKVKWLWKDASQEGVPIPEANFARNTFQRVEKAKDEILQCIKKALGLKPYILIIDEINRGNISKILGELITLIEPSKRIGNDEALEVTLPYSQESFGVPNNLYIIGTMNTADRSIALLDTALRRRFEFIEMMPQPNLLQDYAGVNLQKLLESINHRIEFLLDREHTIGHAYFIGVETLEKLQAVFAKKIIPLLQEYFYEDYAKIDAVLNGNGMIEFHTMENLKINLSDEFVDTEKSIYRITDSSKWDIKTFQKIYDDNIKIDDEN